MDLTRATDAYLTGAIANGDADAARALVDRYRRPLAAVLHRALGAPADVDDVFQETWIRVIRSTHRYDPAQKFSSWLFAIAWNLVKDRWATRVDHDELPELRSADVSAEESMLEEERSRRVRELVARLPERLSQAILLRYFEELSEKQVAERLGIPVGTVKSRLHHGLKKLAAAAGEEDFA